MVSHHGHVERHTYKHTRTHFTVHIVSRGHITMASSCLYNVFFPGDAVGLQTDMQTTLFPSL